MTTKDLKNKIKELSTKQKEMKQQRKTINFKGTRSVEPWEADQQVRINKIVLKHLFITYAILRGKDIYSAINKDTEFSQNAIDKYIKIYGEAVCISQD